MGKEDKKAIEYLIPANVSARFEFFEGFGWYEFKLVSIACLIGLLIFFSLGIFKKTIYVNSNGIKVDITDENNSFTQEEIIEKRIPVISAAIRSFAILIPGVGTFFLVKREPSSGRSTIDTLRYLKEFKGKQKTYLYKYNSGTEG